MGTTAFMMTVDQALVFFQLCHDLKLETEEERVTLLSAMAKQGSVKNVWQTGRDQDQFVKDMARNYKILRVKKDQPKCAD